MDGITLYQLECFDAVVRQGSFQAAAAALHRTHSTVFQAIKKLEQRLELSLFDRDGYRVALTEQGVDFHARARLLLDDARALARHAAQLAAGTESDLTVVIGDLCPLPETLSLLRRFFDACPDTRLHIGVEALSGPFAQLSSGEADLMFHYLENPDPAFERIETGTVQLVPVVAPGFLRIAITKSITPEQMRGYVQCVIRDSAKTAASRDYYLVEGARNWTVGDQMTKKEIILQGMGWGHMPRFLVEDELRSGKLISIAGRHFKGASVPLAAIRRRDTPHGPVARQLWQFIAERAKGLSRAL